MGSRSAIGAAVPLVACALLGVLEGSAWLWWALAAVGMLAGIVAADLTVLVSSALWGAARTTPLPRRARVVAGPTRSQGTWIRVVELADGRQRVEEFTGRGWQACAPATMLRTVGLDVLPREGSVG